MSIELVPYPFCPTNIVRPAVPRCGGQCFNYDVRYGALKFRVEVSGKLVRMVDVDEPSYDHILLDPSDPRAIRFLAAITLFPTIWDLRLAGFLTLSEALATARRRSRVIGRGFHESDRAIFERFLSFVEPYPNLLGPYVEPPPLHKCYTGLVITRFLKPLGDGNWGTKQMAQGRGAKALLGGKTLWRFTKYGRGDGWIWINLEDDFGALRAVPAYQRAPLDPRLFVPNSFLQKWSGDCELVINK